MAQRGRREQAEGEGRSAEGGGRSKESQEEGECKEEEPPYTEEGLLVMSLGAWERIQSSKEPRFS